MASCVLWHALQDRKALVQIWSLSHLIYDAKVSLSAFPTCVTVSDSALLPSGDRPYLVSGADDKLAKVWDYQTKACVQTLEGHSHNVSAVCFHPELPVILTGVHPSQRSHSPLLLLLSPTSLCSLWLQFAWLVASSSNRQWPSLVYKMQ